ncbi:TetR/AcrR family transcriptional regulator [Paraburkholderia phenoliruptrix]|uniref:TetR/AcrR family transcriptional regulator n=1 Tax=Paraburkholderia phenoliruptrix TaxID=252970 RepID=A0ABV3WEX7_9BURK|nr:CerR family C-terminal domain-containing protein [Paraburkholderia phenoliruptrix]MDR6391000.1 AcrR family transcriptional regulator [Paraburkholderia phenoliruptrix]
MPTKRASTPARMTDRAKEAKAARTSAAAARTEQAKPHKQAKERRQTEAQRAVKRASRPDGAATRQHLLDIAGQVFAARGFADATSKEICERAGTPMASVNYHFGSREALYEAALVEAHRQVVSLDELSALTEAPGDPRDKLRAVISRFVGLSAGSGAPWGFMLMLREVLSPSPAMPALIEKAVRPKATVLLGLIGEVLQLDPHEPAVQRALMFSVLPCIALMIAPRQVQAALLPAVGKDKNALVEDFTRFVMAGLDALAAAHRALK